MNLGERYSGQPKSFLIDVPTLLNRYNVSCKEIIKYFSKIIGEEYKKEFDGLAEKVSIDKLIDDSRLCSFFPIEFKNSLTGKIKRADVEYLFNKRQEKMEKDSKKFMKKRMKWEKVMLKQFKFSIYLVRVS